MKRPGPAFLGIFLLAMLATPLAAEAQSAGKVARVGILENRAGDADEFRQAFGELGWAVGQNIVLKSGWLRTGLNGSQVSQGSWSISTST